jgi:hypothetical protein
MELHTLKGDKKFKDLQKEQYAGLQLNFLTPEHFDIIEMNTEKGDVKIDKRFTFVAHSLLDAYQQFLATLVYRGYYTSDKLPEIRSHKMEYLLISKEKPMVTSLTLPCVLFAGHEDAAECKENGTSYQDDYQSLIMLGWAIENKHVKIEWDHDYDKNV